jgi:hypothetical protein
MELDRNSTHLAGEYFVAAELYRRGFSVGMTIGNAKAVDMFAEKDGHHYSIQVKAIRDKKSVGWPLSKNKIFENVIYIFVLVNQPNIQPEYFIAHDTEVQKKIKQYKTRGIVDLSSLNNDSFKNRWDKIENTPAITLHSTIVK